MNNPISTGIKAIDKLTGGLHPSEITVIGSRPIVGKTTFLQFLIKNICVEQKIPSLFFNMESAREVFFEQMNLEMPDSPQPNASLPLFLDDTPFLSIDALCERAKALVKFCGVKIVFIDMLGLVSVEMDAKPVYEQMSEKMRKLKNLARELDVPVVVTTQIARMMEDSEPTLDQLRGSGDIEAMSDVVILLHRERYSRSPMSAIIAKNRNGNCGTVKMDESYDRFRRIKGVNSGNKFSSKDLEKIVQMKRNGCSVSKISDVYDCESREIELVLELMGAKVCSGE